MSIWVVHTERTVSADIPGSPADVRAFYTDLDNLKAIHPLVVWVRSAQQRVTAGGYAQTYRICDRIRLGPVRIRIRYTTHLTVPRAGDVFADSRQFPGVRLHTVVSFAQTPLGTLLTERMSIEAPRPLASATVRQAVAAHQEMLRGIHARFGGGA
jgi:hypothetical protein